MSQPHELYGPKDFTQAEYERGNQLARMVIDGGLGVCKKCGAGEAELDDHPTCDSYKEHKLAEYRQRFPEMAAVWATPSNDPAT